MKSDVLLSSPSDKEQDPERIVQSVEDVSSGLKSLGLKMLQEMAGSWTDSWSSYENIEKKKYEQNLSCNCCDIVRFCFPFA